MRNVFISYSRQDEEIASRLLAELRSVSISGWKDSADLSAGSAIAESIRKALRASSAVIVLLTPNALASRWIQFEMGAAEALGKQIIPVVIEGDIEGAIVTAFLKRSSWLDARNRSPKEVAAEIEKILQQPM